MSTDQNVSFQHGNIYETNILIKRHKETYVLSRDKNMSPKVCLHQNSKETYMAPKFGKRDITCLPRTQKRHITGHI